MVSASTLQILQVTTHSGKDRRWPPMQVIAPHWSQRRHPEGYAYFYFTRAGQGTQRMVQWRRPPLQLVATLSELAARHFGGRTLDSSHAIMWGLAATMAQALLHHGCTMACLSQRWAIRWLHPLMDERILALV